MSLQRWSRIFSPSMGWSACSWASPSPCGSHFCWSSSSCLQCSACPLVYGGSTWIRCWKFLRWVSRSQNIVSMMIPLSVITGSQVPFCVGLSEKGACSSRLVHNKRPLAAFSQWETHAAQKKPSSSVPLPNRCVGCREACASQEWALQSESERGECMCSGTWGGLFSLLTLPQLCVLARVYFLSCFKVTHFSVV